MEIEKLRLGLGRVVCRGFCFEEVEEITFSWIIGGGCLGI